MKTNNINFKQVNFWRRLHRWLAYGLGAVFIVQGISGTLMVIAPDLDAWLNPDMVVKQPPMHDLVKMAALLESQRPGSIGVGVKQHDDMGQLIIGFWPEPDPIMPQQRNYHLARLNGNNGDIVSANSYGTFPQNRYDYLAYLYAIHSNLTLGALGRLILIFTTTGALLLLVAGVMNGYNRKRILRLKPQAQRFDSPAGKTHRMVGLSSVVILAILLSSGLLIQYETTLDPAFSYLSQDGNKEHPRLTLTQAWQAALKQYPEAQARLIMAPFVDGGTFRIDLIPAKGKYQGETIELFLDAYSGRLLTLRTDEDRKGINRVLILLEKLHGGNFWGWLGLSLAFLAGLLPLLLLWMGRKSVKNLRKAIKFNHQ